MTRIYRLAAVAFVAGGFIASAVLYERLPDPMPIHFNWKGEADGWAAKPWGVFVFPAAMAAILLLFWALPWLSPRPFSLEKFTTTFHYIIACTLGFFLYLHAVFLAEALSAPIDVMRAFLGGTLLFLAAIGNVLGKVRRNFYVGVRTPWTLASDRVWNDTHRFTARLLTGACLAGFLLLLTPVPWYVPAVLVAAALLAPVPYSWLLYRRHDRQEAA